MSGLVGRARRGAFRAVPFAAAFLLLGSALRWGSGDVPFPAEVPGWSVIGAWERVSGTVETAEGDVAYELYVNPARQALYEITRYRVVRKRTQPDGSVLRVADTEKLLWNGAPDRERLRCWEWVGRRAASRLWLARSWRWEPIEPGSERYVREMKTAIGVYAAANRASSEPGP